MNRSERNSESRLSETSDVQPGLAGLLGGLFFLRRAHTRAASRFSGGLRQRGVVLR